MKKKLFRQWLLLTALLPLCWSARAAELVVDPSAGPYKTISTAVGAAKPGDTVTVNEGVYEEAVSLKSGLPGQPFTLRAAPGAGACISNFQAVTNWLPWHDQIYTTTASWAVRDLYVGYSPQVIARAPNRDCPWLRVAATSGPLVTAAAGPSVPGVSGGNPFLYGFNSNSNTEVNLPVAWSDGATNSITLMTTNTSTGLLVGNTFMLCNHRDLIDQPGEWAYETHGANTTLYFWPKSPDDLLHTQSGRNRTSLSINGLSNVRVEGMEVAGGINGISVQNGSRGVTIDHCVVHDVNGGVGATNGTGIYVRDSSDVTVSGCLALRNHFGVTVTGGRKVVVEACEIAFNREDGLRITGDPARRSEVRLAEDMLARRNYIHHHLLQGHPDNMQIFSGVRRLHFEDNLDMFGGQALMTQETNQDNAVTGNVMFGIVSYEFQTHTDTLDFSFERNLFGFGGWGAIGMSGNNYRVYENIIYHSSLDAGSQYQGDRNVLVPIGSYAVQVIQGGSWKKGYPTLTAYTAASGQDAHSIQADPLLRNVPLDQGFAVNLINGACTSASLFVRRQPTTTGEIIPFTVGDLIEVNGDGIQRQITQVSADLITFTPPLPVRPFREGYTVVWRWGAKTNFQLDTRADAAGPAGQLSARGGPVGSLIDVSAYQAGDFNGDGQRDLPAVPPQLQAAWPDPNDHVIPAWSPL